MELDVITRQWLIIATFGLAIPILALIGLRYVAYRLVGRPETLPDSISSRPAKSAAPCSSKGRPP